MSATKSDASGPSTRSKGKAAAIGKPKGRMHLLDLPLETQKQIVAQVSSLGLLDAQILNMYISRSAEETYFPFNECLRISFPSLALKYIETWT